MFIERLIIYKRWISYNAILLIIISYKIQRREILLNIITLKQYYYKTEQYNWKYNLIIKEYSVWWL